jgi:phosphotriesterase-related protein
MSEPTIVTVRGPVSAEQLGVTLMHEPIFIDLLREFRGDGLLNDAPLAVRELTRFREAGGSRWSMSRTPASDDTREC